MRKLPDPLKAVQSRTRSTKSTTRFGIKAERVVHYARVLLGCFRKGDANDPKIYTRAIVAVLSDYPEEVIKRVVDPRTGIPSRQDFMPTIKELKDACDEIYGPMLRMQEWDRRTIMQVQQARRLAGPPVPHSPEVQGMLARQGISITITVKSSAPLAITSSAAGTSNG